MGDYNKSSEGQRIKQIGLAAREFIFTITRRSISERQFINFYVPDYPTDLIQSSIVDNYCFFNEHELVATSSFLPQALSF